MVFKKLIFNGDRHAAFNEQCGPLLDELGYQLSYEPGKGI